jgi:hypothetical protein
MPEISQPLKEALFVAVGLGVLAAQRANVKRLEFEQQHRDDLSAIESHLDQVLTRVEGNLPEPARTWLHDGRTAGAAAHERLRHRLGSA